MISLTKDLFIYSGSKIFSAILNIFVLVIFTRILNQDDYGQYLIFISYCSFIGSLFYWAHRLSIYRYLNFYNNSTVFLKTNFILFLYTSLFLLYFNIFLIFIPLAFNLKLLIHLSCLGGFLKSFFDLNQIILNAQFKSLFFSVNSILKSAFFLCFSIFLFYEFNLSYNSLIIGFLFSHFIISIPSFLFIFNKSFYSSYDKNIAKKILTFSLPLIGLFFCDYILTFSDRLFIDYYLGKKSVGIYGANYDLIKQLSLFFMMVQSYVLYPRINKAYSDKNIDLFRKLFNYNMKLFLIIFIPLSFVLIYFNNFISTLFLGIDFRDFSYQIIPLFSVMFLMWGIKIYHFDYIFQLKEKTTLPFYILLFGSILNIVLNIIMIPRFEILGALYSTFISYLIVLILSILLTNRLILITFPYLLLIKVLFNLFISSLLLKIIPNTIPFINILCFILFYLFLTFLLNRDDMRIKLLK